MTGKTRIIFLLHSSRVHTAASAASGRQRSSERSERQRRRSEQSERKATQTNEGTDHGASGSERMIAQAEARGMRSVATSERGPTSR